MTPSISSDHTSTYSLRPGSRGSPESAIRLHSRPSERRVTEAPSKTEQARNEPPKNGEPNAPPREVRPGASGDRAAREPVNNNSDRKAARAGSTPYDPPPPRERKLDIVV